MNALAAFLMTPFLIALRGYVLAILWRWFVVDTFSLPPLRIPIALGIATLVALLTHQTMPQEKNKSPWIGVVASAAISLLSLGFGWIYKAFI